MTSRRYKRNIQEKIDALIDRVRDMYRSDPRGAHGLAEEALYLAESIDDRRRIARAHQHLAGCIEMTTGRAQAIEHSRCAVAICEEIGDEQLLALSLRTLAVIYQRSGSIAEAAATYERAIELFTAMDDQTAIAMMLNSLGIARDCQGDHVGAMEAFIMALNYWEGKEEHRLDYAMGCNNIAALAFKIGDTDRAERYFSLALEIYRELDDLAGRVMAMTNLAHLLAETGRPDEALPHATGAIRLLDRLNAPARLVVALDTLGSIRNARGELEEAASCYRRALAIAESIDDKVQLGGIYSSLAKLYERTGDVARAISHCARAIDIAEGLNDRDDLIALHDHASDLYARDGRYQEALEHRNRWGKLREEIFAVEKQRSIVEMQTKYEATVLERENEIQRLRIEQLREEVERRDRELAVMAMQLVQRNEYLARLERELTSAHMVDESVSAEIIGRMRSELRPEGDWEIFTRQFRQVHPEFESKIAGRFPSLTPAEIRVCMLTWIGLATKEIASLLYTSPRTVEHQRASIRRKMEIPAGTSFGTFLTAL